MRVLKWIVGVAQLIFAVLAGLGAANVFNGPDRPGHQATQVIFIVLVAVLSLGGAILLFGEKGSGDN